MWPVTRNRQEWNATALSHRRRYRDYVIDAFKGNDLLTSLSGNNRRPTAQPTMRRLPEILLLRFLALGPKSLVRGIIFDSLLMFSTNRSIPTRLYGFNASCARSRSLLATRTITPSMASFIVLKATLALMALAIGRNQPSALGNEGWAY